MGNPLQELNRLGQSVWLDYLSRDIISSGKLERFIKEDGLSGVTSNPTLFHKAISSSTGYDAPLEALVEQGMGDAKELFLSLAINDIKDAADMLLPTYEKTGGTDGFVSLEVSPDLAYDTDATIREVRELFSAVGKKNVLIKVPGTTAGLPAIEQLVSDGVNVNITLLFSVKRYAEVMEAYLRGIEKRIDEGKPVKDIFSVASFFVSRVDTLTDKFLSEAEDQEKAKALVGRAAVANAKKAFHEFRNVFTGDRFGRLKEQGVKVQKLLWGSSGTKNPDYSDIKYVQELIGPDTVNTMPENTMDAFRDHGEPRVSIEDNLEDELAVFDRLRSVGIEIEDVAAELEKQGVKLFSDSFFELLDLISKKKEQFQKP